MAVVHKLRTSADMDRTRESLFLMLLEILLETAYYFILVMAPCPCVEKILFFSPSLIGRLFTAVSIIW